MIPHSSVYDTLHVRCVPPANMTTEKTLTPLYNVPPAAERLAFERIQKKPDPVTWSQDSSDWTVLKNNHKKIDFLTLSRLTSNPI